MYSQGERVYGTDVQEVDTKPLADLEFTLTLLSDSILLSADSRW